MFYGTGNSSGQLMFPKVPVTLGAMTGRTNAEVGAIVKQRRIELLMSQADLIAASGVDAKTIQALEDGTRSTQERVRLKVEPKLNWAPGTIGRLLEGENPIIVEDVTEEPEAERDVLIATNQTVGLGRGELLTMCETVWESVRKLAEYCLDVAPDNIETRDVAYGAIWSVSDVLTDLLLPSPDAPAAKKLLREMAIAAEPMVIRNKVGEPPLSDPDAERHLGEKGEDGASEEDTA